MNKEKLQAFATGIIFSTAIFAAYYYTNGPIEETAPTIRESKELLIKEGYTVISKDERAHVAKPEASTTKKEEKQKPQARAKENPVLTLTLEVKPNMTTMEIAKELEKEKIIDDATGFDAYIEKQGFSKNIQIGKFVVTNSMSYRQLAKTLTD